MLLLKRDLNAGYQKIDVAGRDKLNSRIALFGGTNNVLIEHSTAAFGYPALPFTLGSGSTITLGGEGRRPR